jgi:acetyl/propionyl-CoA carboxylase alpha subunit
MPQLGLEAVAIHPAIETDALHVRMANEAVLIEAGKPVASYLDIEAIVTAAKSQAPTPCIPAMDSCRRMPTSPAPWRLRG